MRLHDAFPGFRAIRQIVRFVHTYDFHSGFVRGRHSSRQQVAEDLLTLSGVAHKLRILFVNLQPCRCVVDPVDPFKPGGSVEVHLRLQRLRRVWSQEQVINNVDGQTDLEGLRPFAESEVDRNEFRLGRCFSMLWVKPVATRWLAVELRFPVQALTRRGY